MKVICVRYELLFTIVPSLGLVLFSFINSEV